MSYDVFLSYNSEDVALVGELDRALRERGIRTYIDTSELVPGRPWLPELEQAIESSRSVAVLVGAAGLGPWERMEAQAFLARAVREGIAVIPVSLPGGPTPEGLPVLLSNFGWVDLRGGLEAEGIGRLVWGITGERPEDLAQVVGDRPGWRRRSVAEVELHAELSSLGPQVFEEVVYRLQIPWWTFPSYGELAPGERLEQVVESLRGDPGGVESARRTLATVRREHSLAGSLRSTLLGLLAWCLPKVYRWCLDRGIARPGPADRALESYLREFVDWMTAENAGDLVHLASVEVEGSETREAGDYGLDLPLPRFPVIRQIRSRLRQLAGLSGGGDQATAQLASVHRPSRAVRDAVRVLLRSRVPVVLLGDPGSGKSMTLREVGRELARRQSRHHRPALVVYVRLGSFRDRGPEDQPGSVFELVRRSILGRRGGHSDQGLRDPRVWKALPWLMASRRLVVLFDGMDEMDRQGYGARVAVLSRFARQQTRRVKSLFACRINDFSPEMRHRQLVLLPFDTGRVGEYLKKNLRFPIVVEGVEYRGARALQRALLDRPGLAELATNPLMLFLICRFLAEPGLDRWPTQREELFSGYVRRVILRARRAGKLPALPEVEVAPGELAEDDLAALGELSRLAFAILRDGAGAVGQSSVLGERFGDERLAKVIRFGEACGFLFHEEDLEQLRFSHHRLQEYFTARHLAAERHEIAWEELLDQPRWQETLLNLVTLGEGRIALEVLGISLASASDRLLEGFEIERSLRKELEPLEKKLRRDSTSSETRDKIRPRVHDLRWALQPYDRSWRFPAEQESSLSDRLVLASQILAETGESSFPGPPRLVEAYTRSLQDQATYGRPSTQVKTLWAWKNFSPPGRSFVETFSGPLRSKVHWVRDQALLLVGSAAARQDLGSDLASEMGFDLIQGRLLARSRLYATAITRNRQWRWVPAFVLALVCDLVLELTMVAGCAWLVLEYLTSSPSSLLDPRQMAWVTSIGLVVVAVLLIRAGFDTALAVVGSTCSVLLLLEAVERSAVAGPGGLAGMFWRSGLLVGGLALAYLAVFVLSTSFYDLVTRSMWRRSAPVGYWATLGQSHGFRVGRRGIAVGILWLVAHGLYRLWQHTDFLERVAQGAFVGLILLSGLFMLLLVYGVWAMAWDWLRRKVRLQGSLPKHVGVVTALLVSTIVLLLRRGEPGLSWDEIFFFLFALVFLLPLGVLWLLLLVDTLRHQFRILVFVSPVVLALLGGSLWLLGYFDSRAGRDWFFVTLVLVLFVVALAVTMIQFRWALGVMMMTLRRIRVDAWQRWIRATNTRGQAFLLKRTRRRNLVTGEPPRGLTPQEFLTLLEEVESAIQDEPAASVYWRLRHELEQTLRLDRS